MIETVALSLVSTMISYGFDQHLRAEETRLIEGAPQWYDQPVDEKICVSTFGAGSLRVLHEVKKEGIDRLVLVIEQAAENSIQQHMESDRLNPRARELAERFAGKDRQLPRLVKRESKFKNVEFRDKEQKAFVRTCLDRAVLEEYESQRIVKMKKEVLKEYSSAARSRMNQGESSVRSMDEFREESRKRFNQGSTEERQSESHEDLRSHARERLQKMF